MIFLDNQENLKMASVLIFQGLMDNLGGYYNGTVVM